MKQSPQDDPTSYDKASGYGGKIFMGLGVLGLIGILVYVENKTKNQ